MKNDLMIFTRSYPFGDYEKSFIQNELKFLNKKFKNIYLIPNLNENRSEFVPKGVKVICTLIELNQKSKWQDKIGMFFSISLIKELFFTKFNPNKIRACLSSRLEIYKTSIWIENFIKVNNIENPILYTYWLCSSTMACISAKKKNYKIKVVSRCHNFDIYGNEENNFYVPFQNQIIPHLNYLFPVSKHGCDFLKSKFPLSNIRTLYLGVQKPKGNNPIMNDSILRLVSCSHVIARKRLDLLLRGLIQFSKNNPNIEIEWVHIGDGPLFGYLKNLADKSPKNLSVILKGKVDNSSVHELYLKHPFDLFINTSSREGTPVSLMEAISYGIPVLVSAFGGNIEVANKGAGFLFPEDLDEFKIASSIEYLLNNEDLTIIRDKCVEVWSENFFSDKNYQFFYSIVKDLVVNKSS